MSYFLRALLNAWEHETERTVEDAEAIAASSIASSAAVVDILGSASELGAVLAYNLMPDPQGLGDLSAWSVTGAGAQLVPQNGLAPPAPWVRGMSCVSPGGVQTQLIGTGTALSAVEAPPTLTALANLPTGTLTMTSTVGFASSGTVYVGGQAVAYTSKDATHLYGCTGGTGSYPIGTVVNRALEACWWYALAYSTIPCTVRLEQAFSPNAVIGSSATLPATNGWVLWSGSGLLQSGANYRVALTSVGNAAAASVMALSGVTIAQGGDPGGPFSGASPNLPKAAFAWDGGANGSRSRLHTTNLDVIALREAEAGLDVDPVGLTDAQRALYLLKRRQARHHGSAKALVDLIVALIQTEDPGFTSAQVRIVRNYSTRTFQVQIVNYNTTRVLAERVSQLVSSLQPLAMNFGGVSIGWPIAALETAFAGRFVSDVEATYSSVDNAETNTV